MPSPTGPFLPRRAFLESLLLAAWGGEAAVRGAVQAGQEKGRQTTSPAPRAADARIPRLEDSGMRPKMIAQVRGLLARPHGMIVCCGPTVPIRTATLYACLRELDPGKKKIFTVEDPIAYRLDKIAQKPIDIRGGQTYDEGLRSILKQGPDAVMVGEIRDPEAATIACRAAKNGPMILAGFQAGETLIALFGLLELGVDPSLLAPALTAILTQRSVRTLCDACKEPYKPQPEFLKKANLPADKVNVFYRRPQNPQGACAVRRHRHLRPDRDLRTAGRHGADAQDDPPRSRAGPDQGRGPQERPDLHPGGRPPPGGPRSDVDRGAPAPSRNSGAGRGGPVPTPPA